MTRLLALLLCIAVLGIAPGAGLRDSAPEIPDVHFSQSENSHWLTISSKIRHNKTCRWYRSSKGRPCRSDEGRACKVCGG